ncbi:MAG TPA: hypothetical protein VII52_01175, partial [Gemmatimonadaceae bacterium]
MVTQLEIWAPHALLKPTTMPGPRAAVSAAYLLATLALVVRARFPLAAVALMCAPLAVEWIAFGTPESFGSFILVMVAAYSVAAHAERRRAVVGLGVLLVAAAVYSISDPTQSGFSQHVSGLEWL